MPNLHLPTQEKKFFDERVPYPVRTLFFPQFCAVIAKAIPFCAYPRYGGTWLSATLVGSTGFGATTGPRWSGQVEPSWFARRRPASGMRSGATMVPNAPWGSQPMVPSVQKPMMQVPWAGPNAPWGQPSVQRPYHVMHTQQMPAASKPSKA